MTTSQCSGKYRQFWLKTKSRSYSDLGPKELIFCFGAFFGDFSDFGANFLHIFKFSRQKRYNDLIFWGSELAKIYFGAKLFADFLWVKKWAFCPLCHALFYTKEGSSKWDFRSIVFFIAAKCKNFLAVLRIWRSILGYNPTPWD